ncbi:carboxypeptidase B [Strongylocentrotus purpuratus]|uniref:Peptidase M14 domain-containing protein n=1 Tax=Strongylocentrotus purpuratus TaxID=7668 RepID=A0A7M7NUP0_STRPU|nr:carboxypeptidase B [Strongylocentrotus purpuratus]
MVSPDRDFDFLESVSRPGLSIETWIPNVQERIDEEAAEMTRVRPNAGFNYDEYHTYDEINAWMDDFVSQNSKVTKIKVSKTYEGVTVYGLQFKKNFAAKKIAYIEGGIHAREWVSPATMMYMAKFFAEDYDTDSTVKSMLDNFVWIIVPVLNIDGYKYTQTDRMWRKNRHTVGTCKGVDLNRNFDHMWKKRNFCDDTYPGTEALSEPETSGVNDFLLPQKNNLVLFIDFHAYGQLWLHPWGHTGSVIWNPDRTEQRRVADITEAAINANGKPYDVGESGPDMYPASGASEDYGYGSLGVVYSYVVELRDTGRYGFLLPTSLINPTAEEIYAGMKALGTELVKKYA